MSSSTSRHPPSIDQGLPASRDGWPVGVLGALDAFSQGDAVLDPPLHYFADPTKPVWARTSDYSPSARGPEIIICGPEWAPRYGVITSQTCDIVEEDSQWPRRPWVQIAPAYDRSDLDGGTRKLLRQGKGRLELVHLPALPGFWVMDLRIEVPVEKGWLASQTPLQVFSTEEQKQDLGRRLGMLRARTAFSKRFVDAVQRPLSVALRELQTQNRALYAAMDSEVDEVVVEVDSALTTRHARVGVLVDGRLTKDVRDWWDDWWDAASMVAADADVTLAPFAEYDIAELTVAEYRRMQRLPLERVSPN